MADVPMIAGAIESAKALYGLAKLAATATVDHQVKDKLIDIQQGILDLQQKLGDAHGERLELLEEVAGLRARLRTGDEQRAKLDAYEMLELEPGLIVYRPKPGGHTVDHYACPSCYSRGQSSILVVTKSGSEHRTLKCMEVACQFLAFHGKPDPIRRTRLDRGRVM